ncbi:glycosyl transferase [Rhodococcus sp. 14-2470-1b]|uniref:glycosyl transferase n=1 Tax=Rhodococcus sp. 14-2470-1b TaxID=2023149 RepID=UPI000B9A47B6|nr:glycosyl transferase [Rhodococcus sp. 14-2470-1b]OZF53839.1 glycosyl transferase [Rhodococcus sp. 14-2470-1b]
MPTSDQTVLEQPRTAPARRIGALSTRLRRADRADVAAASAFTVVAFFVLQGQWRNLGSGYLYNSGQDQAMWEWFFAVAAHSVAHLENPMSSDLQNFPLGVNLMANTAMFGLSIPLAPVTLLFGPTVTWAIALTVGLAGTAYAWYWLFSRTLDASRPASALGGALCGFAPGMISHANGHPNFVVLFLLPVIAALVVRTAQDGPTAKRTIALGLVVALQIMLGEEPLLIFAIAFGLFAVVYYVGKPRSLWPAVKNSAKSLPLAAALAIALVAFPLYWQFFGPQSYSFLEHGAMGNDAKALTQFPTQSIGGVATPGQNVRINATEENAYFGWPLLVLAGVAAVWLWRVACARAAVATAVAVAVLSLGSELIVGKNNTEIALPWEWLADTPLVESILETRFALAAVPALALLLVLATDKAFKAGLRPIPALWSIALALALVPLLPTPLDTVERASTPSFFASGEWKNYVDDGSVVTVPLPRPEDARPLHWQIEADMGFPLAGGYFVGPGDNVERKAKYGAVDRPTALLLGSVRNSGTVPDVTAQQQADARSDLQFWGADVVVLQPGRNSTQLRDTVDELLGFDAEYHDGVWIWDVRDFAR